MTDKATSDSGATSSGHGDSGKVSMPDDLAGVLAQSWAGLAQPGNELDGHQRMAIAAATRQARSGNGPLADLPDTDGELVDLVVTRPWDATEEGVRRLTATLGERRYVEIVGTAVATLGMDTITALLGVPLAVLPDPAPGQPSPAGRIPNLRRTTTWIAIDGPAGPRRALASAPSVRDVVNGLFARLNPETLDREKYRMSDEHRLYAETVAVATSVRNQCSHCLLVHLSALLGAAHHLDISLNLAGMASAKGDAGFPGSRELMALGRAATESDPDHGATQALAQALGPDVALMAAERAAAMQMANRLVQLTGQPVPRKRVERIREELRVFGATEFPHAGLVVDTGSGKRAKLKRLLGR